MAAAWRLGVPAEVSSGGHGRRERRRRQCAQVTVHHAPSHSPRGGKLLVPVSRGKDPAGRRWGGCCLLAGGGGPASRVAVMRCGGGGGRRPGHVDGDVGGGAGSHARAATPML
jgi:hypothetical protein